MRLFELAEDLKIKGSTKTLKEFLNANGFVVKTNNDEVPQRGVELALKEMPTKLAASETERQQKEKVRHKRENEKRVEKRKQDAELREKTVAEEKKRKAEADKLAREEHKHALAEAKRKALEDKAAAKQRTQKKKKHAAVEEKKTALQQKKAPLHSEAHAKAEPQPPAPEASQPAAPEPAVEAKLMPPAAPPAPPTARPAPPPPPPVGVSRDAYQTRSTVRPAAPSKRVVPPPVPATPAQAPAAAKPKFVPPPLPPPVGVVRKDITAKKSGNPPAAGVEKVPHERLKKHSTLADDLKSSLEQAQSQTLTKRSRDERETEEDRQKRKKPHFSGVENRDELINRPRTSASAALRQVIAERVAPANVPGLRKLRKMRHGAPGVRPSGPAVPSAAPGAAPREIIVSLPITVRDFSQATGIKVGDVIGKLMRMNIMANINQALDRDTIELFAVENNLPIKFDEPQQSLESSAFGEQPAEEPAETMVRRNPVVTFMGHVDHGKTSLLDAIRQTSVAAGESGGITQHIGASQVTVPSGTITFVDTPGHEAFTAMRARGARVTDIAVLVVAADDGLMPQSLEAIDHARAANVPIMVAINKIDLPGANPDRVLAQLAERGLTPEAWGGETICCNVSAITREGLDKLLEMICLQAEILELRARPSGPASGVVLEAVLDAQRGPLVTLMVQHGRVQRGDAIVCGTTFARARALLNFRSEPLESAGPADPVLVLGFDSVPTAGSPFRVATSERHARELVEERRDAEQLKRHAEAQKVSLETFYRRMANEQFKELRLIIKGDTQGTTEAVRAALERLSSGEAKVGVLHSGVGAVTDNDVSLASASDAVILAFRVDVQESARALAKSDGVDIKTYDVIYHATDEIQRALQGLLEPVFKEVETGVAEVRAVFELSAGTIAGSHVISGTVQRSNRVRVMRAGEQIFEGDIQSLRHVKDEVREVRTGFDCGILLRGFTGVHEGDRIISFKLEREAVPGA